MTVQLNRRRHHRYKSIEGAVRRVRELEKHLAWYEKYAQHADVERLMLAKLAAKEAQFFNPLDVWEAEKVRDRILRNGFANHKVAA